MSINVCFPLAHVIIFNLITGSRLEIADAAEELVDMIAKDPLSGSCFQINYSETSAPSLNTTTSIRPSILSKNSRSFYEPFDR